jgi:glutaredoxin
MKYKLKVIVLENCPYSIAANELLTNYHIPFQKIIVNQNNKAKYKNDLISTFPQIYILNKNKEILLGGYNDIEEIIDIINSSNNLDILKEKLNKKYATKFNDNKIILRIIQIFNKN